MKQNISLTLILVFKNMAAIKFKITYVARSIFLLDSVALGIAQSLFLLGNAVCRSLMSNILI